MVDAKDGGELLDGEVHRVARLVCVFAKVERRTHGGYPMISRSALCSAVWSSAWSLPMERMTRRFVDGGEQRLEHGGLGEPRALPVLHGDLADGVCRAELTGDGHQDDVWPLAVIGRGARAQ